MTLEEAAVRGAAAIDRFIAGFEVVRRGAQHASSVVSRSVLATHLPNLEAPALIAALRLPPGAFRAPGQRPVGFFPAPGQQPTTNIPAPGQRPIGF